MGRCGAGPIQGRGGDHAFGASSAPDPGAPLARVYATSRSAYISALGIRNLLICVYLTDLGIRSCPICVYLTDLGIHESAVYVYLTNLGIRKSSVHVYLSDLCIPNSRLNRACRKTASSVPAVTLMQDRNNPLVRYTQVGWVYTTRTFAYTQPKEALRPATGPERRRRGPQ